MQKKHRTEISQLTEAVLTHTCSPAHTRTHTVSAALVLLLSLTTSCSQNYTQAKWWPAEKKLQQQSDDLIVGGCAVVRFYVAVSDKQETSTAKNITEMNILTSCVCVVLSHLFTGCAQRSHLLTCFIFWKWKSQWISYISPHGDCLSNVYPQVTVIHVATMEQVNSLYHQTNAIPILSAGSENL